MFTLRTGEEPKSRKWRSLLLIKVCPTPPGGLLASERIKQGYHIPAGYILVLDQDHRANAQWALPSAVSAERGGDSGPHYTAARVFRRELGLRCTVEELQFETKWVDPSSGDDQYLYSVSVTDDQCAYMEQMVKGLPGDQPRRFTKQQFAELIKSNKFSRDEFAKLCDLKLVSAFGRDTRANQRPDRLKERLNLLKP